MDKGGEVVTTLRLSREQHQGLREIAEREHRSLSGELRLIIDRHVAANRKQGA